MKITHLPTGRTFSSWRGAHQKMKTKDISQFTDRPAPQVICEQTLEIFPTIREARKKYGPDVIRKRFASGKTFRYWDGVVPLPAPKISHKTGSIRIRINELGEVFPTAVAVAKRIGVTPSAITNVTQGIRQTINGFTLTLED